VEFANIIHSAGTDLLQLINDILDLSKVEAGKMDVHSERIAVTRLLEDIETTFRPLTTEKGLEFRVDVASDVPAEIHTDEQRLRQILRNLLSNAVKFTERGGVELRVRLAADVTLPSAGPGEPAIAFAVTDTGIGIAEDNLETIFGAFQQGDGTTSRRYGGTGLGLSISREVAGLLGGEIDAESRVGQGTTFTLYLPVAAPQAGAAAPAPPPMIAAPAPPRRRRLLVLDPGGGLLTALARSAAADLADTHGNVEITRVADEEEAVETLRAVPHACVLLDPGLPAAAAFFEALDRHPGLGAVPVLAHSGRRLSAAQERSVAARARSHPFELLSSLDELRERVTLYLSGGGLADALPFTSPVAEPARGDGSVADDAAGGLGYAELAGRRVLIIDDDVRNVFAISSVLELYGMSVIHAPNGKKGIEVLRDHGGIELVLMDIMMPEMDGYATMAAIREMPRFADLPIIAVTARAMHGDREKSLSAGATDHVAKPVDTEELLSCMKRWLQT
jgi:CheY-like chemotaxis protein/two-component sensor histidine kinase